MEQETPTHNFPSLTNQADISSNNIKTNRTLLTIKMAAPCINNPIKWATKAQQETMEAMVPLNSNQADCSSNSLSKSTSMLLAANNSNGAKPSNRLHLLILPPRQMQTRQAPSPKLSLKQLLLHLYQKARSSRQKSTFLHQVLRRLRSLLKAKAQSKDLPNLHSATTTHLLRVQLIPPLDMQRNSLYLFLLIQASRVIQIRTLFYQMNNS